jgi:type VI secretion system secreted protein VgrG
VVTFLEGDPDRPLITGSVYNADQEVPYALPGEQTKSTLKSSSSKGGSGFNEIRIEDKADSEQIFIHAQKDYHLRVKNERREWIGKDRHLVVQQDKLEKVTRDVHISTGRDEIKKIARDYNLKVSGKSAVEITGSSSLKVTQDLIEQITGNHSSQVTQNIYLKGMQVVIEASTGLTLKVGGSFVTIDPSGVAIKGPLVQINSGGSALSGSAGSLVSPAAPTDAQDADDAQAGSKTTPSATPQQGGTGSGGNITADQRQNQSAAPAAGAEPAAPPPPTHDPNAPENEDKSHWIEIELKDDSGKAVPGEDFRITLPDGKVYDGRTDDKGMARVPNIDPGQCKITFPKRDQDAWRPS